MKTDTSQTNFDPSAQENYFIESGVISPIFIRTIMGLDTRFSTEINGKAPLARNNSRKR